MLFFLQTVAVNNTKAFTVVIKRNSVFTVHCFALLSTITYLTRNSRQFWPILTKRGNSGQIFVEWLHIKFYKNPSSGNRADTCGTKDRQTDGWTDGSDEVKRRISRPMQTYLKWPTVFPSV